MNLKIAKYYHVFQSYAFTYRIEYSKYSIMVSGIIECNGVENVLERSWSGVEQELQLVN